KFPFFRHFFLVFPGAFENYWKFFTFDPPKYKLHSLSYPKQGPFFKIGALLLLQNVVTDTKIKKKKKNTHHCKINTFFTPFRI
ncbi:Sec23 trunk domain-containing protein, partial [Aphis craccivora]